MAQSFRTCVLLLLYVGISHCSLKDEILRDKIVIVGAGASGIAAASKLLELGYQNIVVLEAQNRIGGRVRTEFFGDDNTFIELGTHLIVGESGNIFYDLAMKAGIVGIKLDELDQIFSKYNGESVAPEHVFPLWLSYPAIISTFANKNQTVSQLFGEYVEQLRYNALDKDTSTQCFRMYVEAFTPISDWNDETGAGFRSFVNLNGSSAISLTKSATSILHVMMDSYPANELSPKWREIIQLNAKVERINWNQARPTVQFSKSTEPHFMEEIEADHVIVTIPLGVLKQKHKSLFAPPLPERKVDAIRNLAIGMANKIFLTYDHQWWPDNRTFYVVWNEAQRQLLKKNDQWLSNVLALTAEEYYPNTLTVWVIEKDSLSTEHHSDKEVHTKFANFVRQIFANQGWNITDPISMKRTRWQHDPMARGSYSYRGVKAFNKHITNTDLRESLRNVNGKKTVLFAGEATHDKYYGLMHGAIESGYLAANKISEMHNLA